MKIETLLKTNQYLNKYDGTRRGGGSTFNEVTIVLQFVQNPLKCKIKIYMKITFNDL